MRLLTHSILVWDLDERWIVISLKVYNLRRLRGEALDVIPRFFLLPRDYDEFKNDYERSPKRLYIQKVSQLQSFT